MLTYERKQELDLPNHTSVYYAPNIQASGNMYSYSC